MALLANLVTTIARLLVGVAIMGGFLWLVVRLISRMTRYGPKSPPGSEPADRTDDEDRKIY